MLLLLRDTVEGNQVGVASRQTSSLVDCAESLDAGSKLSRGVDVLESSEVDSKTGNMGSSHGSTSLASGAGGGANVQGEDGDSRGHDINLGAEVGVGVLSPVDVNATDGQGVGGRGGRDVGSGLGLVTGSDNAQDAITESLLDEVVESSRWGTA